jgi:hypothetical protein
MGSVYHTKGKDRSRGEKEIQPFYPMTRSKK